MNFYITEKQKNYLNEIMLIENTLPQLPSHLLNNKDNPLLDSPSLSSEQINRFLSKRFSEIKSEFVDDITKYNNSTIINKLNKLIYRAIKIEEAIRPNLENLALEILTETFNIPENGIKITCTLQPEIDKHREFHITPDNNEDFEYEDVSSMENEDNNIKKRELLNALIVGGAMKLSKNIMREHLSKIFDINEELPHLYSQILTLNNYLLFTQKFEIKDDSHKQGGFVIVKMGNDITPTKIEANAVIFPILLIELLRGCMELWISHGLPNDISLAHNVINKADALVNDPWYMRIGTVLWDKISFDEDLKYLPTFFTNLSELSNDEFFAILKELFANTKLGKKEIAKIIADAKYSDDYSSFEYDIQQKQAKNNLLIDNEM